MRFRGRGRAERCGRTRSFRRWSISRCHRGRSTTSLDLDLGAELGIAVTAADATNGSWWFSTDGGSNWTAFGFTQRQQRSPALGRCQYAPVLPVRCRLQRHARERDHVPRLGSDQRQQWWRRRHDGQRRLDGLLLGHRHREPDRHRGQRRAERDQPQRAPRRYTEDTALNRPTSSSATSTAPASPRPDAVEPRRRQPEHRHIRRGDLDLRRRHRRVDRQRRAGRCQCLAGRPHLHAGDRTQRQLQDRHQRQRRRGGTDRRQQGDDRHRGQRRAGDHQQRRRCDGIARRGRKPTAVTISGVDRRATAAQLAYSIAGGADAALLHDRRATGVLTFVAAPDFEAPDRCRRQQRLRRDGAGVATATAARHAGDRGHGDQRQRGAGDHQRRRRPSRSAENQTAVTTVTASDVDGGATDLRDRRRRRRGAVLDRCRHRRADLRRARRTSRPRPMPARDNVYDVTVQVADGNGGTRHAGDRGHGDQRQRCAGDHQRRRQRHAVGREPDRGHDRDQQRRRRRRADATRSSAAPTRRCSRSTPRPAC